MLALLALLGMQQRLILSEPVGSLRAWVWTQVRTAQRAQLKIHKIQSLGGNIRGARRGVLRRRLVTVRPGRPGTPPARHYDLAARSSLHGSGRQLPAVVGRRAPKETEARPRVKNRHGGAPRGERPASWDARRLACRVMCTPHGCSAEHPNVSRRSAHPSFGVSEAKLQTPGAKMRRGNEMGCLTS